jgi:hypothetical protein
VALSSGFSIASTRKTASLKKEFGAPFQQFKLFCRENGINPIFTRRMFRRPCTDFEKKYSQILFW